MFLKTIPSLQSINLSNIVDNSSLKKYEEILKLEELDFSNLKDSQVFDLFDTFISVLDGSFCHNEVLISERYFGERDRTCYRALNDSTNEQMTDILVLLHYICHCLKYDIKPFKDVDTLNDRFKLKFNDLLHSGYNLFDEKDFKELLNYFFSYELVFRFTNEK
jgi:hypothetical protein